MTLWLVFALMTAAAIFAVLWPLSRRAPVRAGSELAVYRDQLDEIARDRSGGRIGEPEAEAARVEVSRRLIAAAQASDEMRAASPARALVHRRIAALAGLVVLPVIAATLYLALGSPNLPGEPLAARSQVPDGQRSLASLVSQAEAHIERNPNDGRGWEVLAPVYLRLGRFDDAVKARRNALALNGENAERQADLGEALVAAANGIVTQDAKAAFERALASDAKHAKSRFFVGLAFQQDGQRPQAAAQWQSLLADAPADAPWAPSVRQALTDLGVAATPAPAASGPSAEDIAAAAAMSESDRTEMVRGMVARLAERLKQEPADADGWLRLMRAYMVLGERDKARTAAADAKAAFASEPERLRRVEDLIKELGLEGS